MRAKTSKGTRWFHFPGNIIPGPLFTRKRYNTAFRTICAHRHSLTEQSASNVDPAAAAAVAQMFEPPPPLRLALFPLFPASAQELEEKFIEELGLVDADLPERYLATKKLADGDELALKA